MNREIVASLILRLKDQMSRDLPKTNAALKRHMDQMKKLDQAAKAMAGYDKAKANLQKMRAELDKTRENIRRIKTAMKTADDASLAKLRSELGQAQAKSNKTATAMVADMKRVQTAIKQLNAQGIKPKDIGATRDRIDRERQSNRDHLAQDQRRERTGQILRNGGANLRSTGVGGMGYSVGAGYTAGRAIGGEYNFQYEANETRAKLYGTEDPEKSKAKFQSLVDLAIKTAETRPWTSGEVMAGGRYLAGTGLNQAQVEGALTPTVDLATAGGRNLGIDGAADISTNILMAMKLPMQTTEEVLSSLQRVNDVLAYTAAKANTDVVQLGQAFKYAAPLAGQMGVSIEQLASYFAVMANNGIKKDEAGVALRSALVRMIKPVKPMLGELERLGIGLDDFVKRSKPLSGEGLVKSLSVSGIQARGLEPRLQRLIDNEDLGGADLTNAIADVIREKVGDDSLVDSEILTNAIVEALSSGVTDINLMGFLEEVFKKSGGNPGGSAPYIFDARQGARLSTMITAPDDPNGPRGYLTRIGDESGGTAANMSAIMMDGIVGDLKRLQSAMDSFMRTFFESGAADTVSELAEAGAQFLKTLKEIDPRLLDLGAKFFALSLLVGPLIYAMGGVLSIAGGLMMLKGLAGKGGVAGAIAGAAGAAAIGGKDDDGAKKNRKGGGRRGGIGLAGWTAGIASAVFGEDLIDLASDWKSDQDQIRKESEPGGVRANAFEDWVRERGLMDVRSSSPRRSVGPSARDAERESMNALRSDPNGVQDALDTASMDRQSRNARTDAQVNEIMARAVAGAIDGVNRAGKAGRLGATPIPRFNPASGAAESRIGAAFETTAQTGEWRGAIDGMIAAIERQTGSTQSVRVEAPVTTQPSGTQNVNVTNPPPPVLAPVNVTVNVTQTNASPSAIGAAAGNAVSQAQRNAYSDD